MRYLVTLEDIGRNMGNVIEAGEIAILRLPTVVKTPSLLLAPGVMMRVYLALLIHIVRSGGGE